MATSYLDGRTMIRMIQSFEAGQRHFRSECENERSRTTVVMYIGPTPIDVMP